MKGFNPSIYNYTNPVGLDYEISLIQTKLARITWMEAIFGRAYPQWRLLTDEQAQNMFKPAEGLKGRDKYTIYYPQGRKLDQDIDLSFDDTYASRCFFYIKDQATASPKTDTQDWTSYNVEIEQKMCLIFSGNVDKLECPSTEILKTVILYQLNNCPRVVIDKIHENLESVWNDFTITQSLIGIAKYPFYCLRIDFTLTYLAFPFNGMTSFDPSVYDNPSGEEISPNTNPGYPNIN